MINTLKKINLILNSKDKEKILFFLISIIFVSILEILGISLIIPMLEVLLNKQSDYQFFNFAFDKNNINELIYLFISIIIIKNFLLIFVYYWQKKFSTDIYCNISHKLLKNYIYRDLIFHKEKNSSELINNVIVVSKRFSSLIISLSRFFAELIMTSFVIFTLLYFSFKFTLLSFIFISISSLIYLLIFKKKSFFYGVEIEKYSQAQIKSLQEIFHGVKDIKLKKLENFFSTYFFSTISKYARPSYLQATIGEIPKIWLELTFLILILLISFFFNSSSTTFENYIPTIGLFVFASFRLLPSVNRIISSFQSAIHNQPSLYKLENFLNRNDEIFNYEKNNQIKEIVFKNEIKIQNIDFKFIKDKFIFNNFSCSFFKNKFNFIKGKSGSGKSTLLDLIMGFLDPEKGQILCDDKNLKNFKRLWQDKISYLSQHVFLLDESILDNILFGQKKNFDKKKMEKILNLTNLRSFIDTLPDKMQTRVGEKGQKLSGGQIQRIGIARELYRDTEILIFDESTNALDDENEKDIINCLKDISKFKTIIFVSHNNHFKNFSDHTVDLDTI